MKIAFPREIIPASYTFRALLGNTMTFFVFNLLPGILYCYYNRFFTTVAKK